MGAWFQSLPVAWQVFFALFLLWMFGYFMSSWLGLRQRERQLEHDLAIARRAAQRPDSEGLTDAQVATLNAQSVDYSDVQRLQLIARVKAIISSIVYLQYEFIVDYGHGGVYVRGRYIDSDVYTGMPETQLTRRWLLHPSMTESEIVFTIFKCCMTSMEHRCREDFLYCDTRVCSPHFDVQDLVKLCKSGRENAGGRRPNVSS